MPGKSIRIQTISPRPTDFCINCELENIWSMGKPTLQTTTTTLQRLGLVQTELKPVTGNYETPYIFVYQCTKGCQVEAVTTGVLLRRKT